MFRRKVKEDPTELQLLKIRVQNIEKEIAELKRAPQVQTEELESIVKLKLNGENFT
ncbi:hypothetical protein [Proteiniclasticum sp. QWL-01]|uniref:hypothetical protein n=1 Tax=Proteiniclasticum sp. QWL-01 TaxID=3036945 RepID=UPI002410F3C9|nr:hypothetical protein [Proteiniclasticum sp. QWL-01]WFF73980.1 hypothetical protein P6M73_05905 [Proteiniclasticum sp. QWL-01]